MGGGDGGDGGGGNGGHGENNEESGWNRGVMVQAVRVLMENVRMGCGTGRDVG